MDKRGFLKTLEAILAIILILVVVYTIIPKFVEPKPNPPLAVQDAQRFIIADLSNDDDLRAMILNTTDNALLSASIEAHIRERMPVNYDFVCAICPQTSSCVILTPLSKAIYMSDVFIASSMGVDLSTQKPKIVRFWMWAKPSEGITPNTCTVI
jgi:hypothetical protein